MFDFHPQLKQRFAALRTGAEFFSLRYVRESGQYLSVRKNVAEPPHLSHDEGAMLTVRVNGVETYAATHDISLPGLQAALERAEQQMALHTWNATATDFGAHANLQTLFERQAHATPDAVAVVRGGRGEGGRNRPPDCVALAGGVVREADEVGFVYYILIHLTLPSFTFVSYFYDTTGEGKAT